MPLFATSQEWLEQSALLLEARPSTTRITTTYTHAKPRRYRRRKLPLQPSATSADASAAPDAAAPAAASATLTLKTHDPASGVTLKYRTPKAAEVGRLIAACGRLGHGMARTRGATGASVLEEGAAIVAGAEKNASADGQVKAAAADEDTVMVDAGEDGEAPAQKTHERRKKSVSFAAEPPKVNAGGQGNAQGQGQGGGGSGGGKKKKKGGKK